MDTSSLIFILLSIVVICYVLFLIMSKKRVHLLFEIAFLGAYFVILLLVLFPSLLDVFSGLFGIGSGINFIVYLSIFVAYFLIFMLYNKHEDQRVEITKLTREIAFLKYDKNKKK